MTSLVPDSRASVARNLESARTGPKPSAAVTPAVDERPSDWGSLVADLSSRRSGPSIRQHDRTHLEIAVDYRIDPEAERSKSVWEAYLFVPESLRLHSQTYAKSDLYADLQSYVRFEVPEVAFSELANEPVARLREAITLGAKEGTREIRLFACRVRAAGVDARNAVREGLEGSEHDRSRALAAAARMVADARRIGAALREAVASLPADADDNFLTAARWVDEDVSRLLETLMANLARALTRAGAPESLVESATAVAVAEARYRRDAGLQGVGRISMSRREVEELEFRRHVLKRFTSSVLWLRPEVRPAGTWALHLLYAIAASVAMAFAVAAAVLNGPDAANSGNFMGWVVVVIIAYAAKDRIKALLQARFQDVISRHFPDRHWRIHDPERGLVLGEMDEEAGFVRPAEVDAGAMKARLLTRVHPIEAQARPENILFHSKEVTLERDPIARADARFSAITEIFRLDLRRWLAHTDDPKRDIVFADVDREEIGTAVAPRVYNIGIVYRLRSDTDTGAPWHRARVVVTRKGIRRVDVIC